MAISGINPKEKKQELSSLQKVAAALGLAVDVGKVGLGLASLKDKGVTSIKKKEK